MKREEIERAIENGESVWYLKGRAIKQIDLKFTTPIFNGYQIDIMVEEENGCHTEFYGIKDLYKTHAEAEHYLHHANITRTETLHFLTWEDIKIQMKKMESFGLNRNDRVLARIITKDSIYYFKLCKDFDLFTFQLKQTYIGEDLCEQIRDKFPVSLGETTEANFYKAYDECVRLFKG